MPVNGQLSTYEILYYVTSSARSRRITVPIVPSASGLSKGILTLPTVVVTIAERVISTIVVKHDYVVRLEGVFDNAT